MRNVDETAAAEPATFGALVRRHRQAASLSQEALAERAGLSTDAISVIERGKRGAPRPHTVALLARAFGLSEEERAAFAAAARAIGASPEASVAPVRASPLAFPPLLTPLTALVGRAREVTAVRARLLEPGTRLLTLTGPGGVGKTRLAMQVAAEVLDAFLDGVFFINLAPITDPALVLSTIAQTLDVRAAGSQPLRDALHASLQDKRLLLVLDNFEQVFDAAPVVAELLAACAQVRVLATSRAALRLRGERLYAVPPLALPELTPLPPLATLTRYEAVRLFIERARDVRPDFAITDETAPSVAAICVCLDGLPLTIELAAARVRLFTPQALLARLAHRLRALTGGARDLPERQRTLRATIDWSYSLLTVAEQTLFARLGVFVGDCTLEAVEAVCATEGDLDLDVLAGLESLVAQSLLWREEGLGGVPRVGMLETIHEYARERLEASGGADELRRQHATYFLKLAEEAEPGLMGPEQGAWLERLEREHDNLRAALRWARERGEVELALRGASALGAFWQVRGYWSEGRLWLEALLALVESNHCAGLLRVRAKALQEAGQLAFWQGEYERAMALAEDSLALWRTQGDKRGVAGTLRDAGLVALYQNDCERALAPLEESLTLYRELGDTPGIANALSVLGAVARDQGEYGHARILLEESLALYRNQGDVRGSSFVLNGLGNVARYQDDVERAVALYEESLALMQDLGDKRGVAHAHVDIADLALDRDDTSQAAAHYAEALAQCSDPPYVLEAAMSLEGVARLSVAQQRAAVAARLWGAAAHLRDVLRAPLPLPDRARYDRDMAAMRGTLGNDAFAELWADGWRSSVAQVLAAAQETLRNRPA